jgi:GTP cyclohydrolase IB
MKSRLNDVAVLPPEKNLELTLDEVGVENVQSQVQLQGLLLPAKSNSTVSLIDRQSRGIHMSRIFRVLMGLQEQELNWAWLKENLQKILESHEGLSDSGKLEVSFELPVRRKAIVSEQQGWRNYPVTYKISSRDGELDCRLTTKVLYSSTCPCSAAISRQAVQAQFAKDFEGKTLQFNEVADWLGLESSMVAVPHAQRSEAICEFVFNPEESIPSPISLIDAVEETLGTPVQTAVKREDEQEFARLNAANLMFCEDAARKLKSAFMDREDLADFIFEVRHFESLHAHDVVAKVRKLTKARVLKRANFPADFPASIPPAALVPSCWGFV